MPYLRCFAFLAIAAAAALQLATAGKVEGGGDGCGCSSAFGGRRRIQLNVPAAACPLTHVKSSLDALPPDVDNVTMTTIPAGEYAVGTDTPQLPGDPDREAPARRVRFRRPFLLDRMAVTRGQFERFVQATGHQSDAELAGESFVPEILVAKETFSDPHLVPGRVSDAPWWLPVRGATWRLPSGPLWSAKDSPICNKDSPNCNKDSLICNKDSPVCNKDSLICNKDSPVCNKDSLICNKDPPICNKDSPVCNKDSPISNKDSLIGKKDFIENGEKFMDYNKDHPVVHVSWRDANAYCKWAGRRLPTEDEWEAACRGGLADRLFPWGNSPMPKGTHRMNIWQGQFPDVNTAEDGFVATSPVDAYGPQNAFGLFNMVGNVWEWTSSRWELGPARELARDGIAEQDAVGPSVEMVKRGGSFMCHKSYCYRYRCAARSGNTADTSSANIGFRCAADVGPGGNN